jgi:hypothetical protein
MPLHRLIVLSDIHYASLAEKRRAGFRRKRVANPLLRLPILLWHHFIWERDPFSHNHLLDRFLAEAPAADRVIANGDYSCDSAFVGVSDDAVCQSAAECLRKLRGLLDTGLCATIGDHELGKIGLGTNLGGMRLASYGRSIKELSLQPFWQVCVGPYVLMGVTSSLIALPVYWPETLPDERPEWQALRERHLLEIRQAFAALKSRQRVLLFCHDPTALPFLWQEAAVRDKLGQVEQTIIGHLHSEWLLRPSRLLAGVPAIDFLGPFVRRATCALGKARHWQPFNVRLCPALKGIELQKAGGYYTVELDLEGGSPARFQRHPIRR